MLENKQLSAGVLALYQNCLDSSCAIAVLFLTLHPEVLPEYLKNMRFAFSGAAPLGSLDEEKFLDKVGRHVLLVQGTEFVVCWSLRELLIDILLLAYGLTETSPLVAANTRFIKEDVKDLSQGSIGHVVANTEAKIVKPGDPTGTPLGPLESGELLVRVSYAKTTNCYSTVILLRHAKTLQLIN